MNDSELDKLLDESIRVEKSPELWERVSCQISSEISKQDIGWALSLAACVLLALYLVPTQPKRDIEWEPLAHKAQIRMNFAADMSRSPE